MSTIWTSISQKTLNKIVESGSIYYIRDKDLKGFGIKVTAKGKASYIAEGRIKSSKTTRINIGDVDLVSLREAKNEAVNLLLRVKKGEDVNNSIAVENSSNDSLYKTMNLYIDTKTTLAKRTIEGYRNVMHRFFQDWMKMPVEAISPALVQDRRNKLIKQGLSEDYVNRGFRTLKLVLNSTELPHGNPVAKFYKKYSLSLQSTVKDTFLSQKQIVQIINGFTDECKRASKEPLDRPVFGYLFFLILTGCRKTEALDLVWSDVEDETIIFRETKNHKKHVIPRIGMIDDVISNVRSQTTLRGDNDRVFRMTHNKLRFSSEDVRTDMNFTLHDLRRTFAEHTNFCGYDDNMIGLALNHKTVSFQRRTYMAGQLAKANLIKEMYLSYQQQLAYYIINEAQEKAPKDFDGWNDLILGHHQMMNFLSVSSKDKMEEFISQLKQW